ncbi:MAG: HNH endonuclease, partial [bacterium]
VLASKRGLAPSRCRPDRSDLDELLKYAGRGLEREERCSARLHWHFQRALLLNEAGYTCAYCRRSAWGVLDEDTGDQPRRTLRFEVDHETTRRRLRDRNRFDAKNLVIACRSCNTVKAEMRMERFLIELKSLARAVSDSRPK